MICPYSGALSTRTAVSYIPYATSFHKQTGNIITFSKFVEKNSVENKHSVGEDESILDSIDESSTENNYDDISISTNALKGMWDGNYIHPDIIARSSGLKIRDRIRQAQSKRKLA